MAQIVNPGFAQVASPYAGLSAAAAQGVSTGLERRAVTRAQQVATSLAAATDALNKAFPQEQGGATAALNSGNADLESAALAGLNQYWDAVEAATGKPLNRNALLQMEKQGMLSSQQMLARSAAIEGDPRMRGMEPQQEAAQTYQAQPVQGTTISQPATQQVGAQQVTQPVQTQAAQAQPVQVPAQQTRQPVQMQHWVPTASPTQQLSISDRVRQAGKVVQPAPYSSPYMVDQSAAAQAAPQQTLGTTRVPVAALTASDRARQAGAQQAQASEVAALQAAARQAPTAQAQPVVQQQAAPMQAATPEVQAKQQVVATFQEAVARGENPGTAYDKAFTPEAARAVANDVSYENPDGSRTIPFSNDAAINLSRGELGNASRSIKGANAMMDDVFKARDSRELGKRLSSVAKALETTAKFTPGAKQFDSVWAASYVRQVTNATPQELMAMGLNDQAKIILEDDRNRVAAEQNSVQLRSVLTQAGVELTGFDMARERAYLDYMGKVMQASGKATAAAFTAKAKVLEPIIQAASEATKGAKTGTAFTKFFEDAGIKNILEYYSGGFGGAGITGYPKPGRGLGGIVSGVGGALLGTEPKRAYRPPTSVEQLAGGGQAAELGAMESNLFGAGSTQQSQTERTRLPLEGASQNSSDVYRQKLRDLYASWYELGGQ
jgi:hypothetical protein